MKYIPVKRMAKKGELVQCIITLHVWPVLEVNYNEIVVGDFDNETESSSLLELGHGYYYVLEEHRKQDAIGIEMG